MSDKVKFGVIVDKMEKDYWGIGISLAHCYDETYIYINLFKWTISIGKLYM